MKKLFTFLMVFAIITGLTQILEAQSPRMAVVEEATQASCPPCATLNPPLQAMMNANTDKAIFIGYQVWWPGYDAMYLDNTTEVQARIGTYYSMNLAPNIIFQGSSTQQSTSYVTQQRINDTYAETSEFDIDLQAEIMFPNLVITGTVTATSEVTGNLKLRLIIAEDVIYNADLVQIGTNGETEFHHVFKKFIEGPNGIDLENSWAVNDTYTINETFDLGTLNIYHYDGVEVVALVQNDDNKYIHQAAKAHDLQITVATDINGSAQKVSGFPDVLCSGDQTITPVVQIQNSGNTALTSMDITYDVNGGTPQVYNWTGDLSTFGKEDVTLDPITFTMEATNNVFVTLENPNGEMDEDISDNTLESSPINIAPLSVDSVTVEILTDNYGDETYWEIRNGNGDIIQFGGNPNVGTTNIGTGTFPAPPHPDMYANATLYTTAVPIDATDCFTFHITDYYGDGMGLSAVPAYYKVLDGLGNEMISGGDDDSFAEVLGDFEGDVTVAVEDIVAVNSINIFPNPVNGSATLNFDLVNQAETVIVITNTVGQDVYTKVLGNLATGAHTEQIDMSSLSNGFYMVQIRLNNEVITKKITVAK